MKYKVSLEFEDGKDLNIKALVHVVPTAGANNGFHLDNLDVIDEDEVSEIKEKVVELANNYLENRVVPEKTSIPNQVVKSDKDNRQIKAKEETVKYYDGRAGYVVKTFEGGANSGRSTKGGVYAGENDLKIHKVVEFNDKEVWIYVQK